MAESFVAALQSYRAEQVFNPWRDFDRENEISAAGAQIRSAQLLSYLQQRLDHAELLLCAEAIGYQGGHFSGIPMTSERLLLGGLCHKQLAPEMVFAGLEPQRTSDPAIRPQGFTEPTATIVWGFFAEHGIDPRRVVLWNAFPWHPWQAGKGVLSNRTPDDQELAAGEPLLRQLLALFNFRQIVAVGEKSSRLLAAMQIPAAKVRHPANGGAGKFRAQLANLL